MNGLPYAKLRDTAESTFFDTCRLGTTPAFEYGALDTNDSEPTYGDGIPCGFKPAGHGEVLDGSAAPIFMATLRLPVGVSIGSADRVEITHRHGDALDPTQVYAVEGAPARGPSATVLQLKLITGNSTL